MKNQLSYQQYRTIDLTLFAVMAAVFEFIIVKVSRSQFFGYQAISVSLAGALTSIMYMRWGLWGGLHCALLGFLYCAYSGATANQYIIYICGNLCSLPAALVLHKLGYERVRKSHWGMLFPLAVIVLMLCGRAAVAMLLGSSPAVAVMFISTDSLSILFTLVIVWIAKRLDGIYENQRHYLLRVHSEDE